MGGTNTCMGVYQFTESNIKLFVSVIKPLIETHTGLIYKDAMSQYESRSIKIDLISSMIAEAKLLIVDVSINNPNVFFELGIAYTLKKPVILLCLKKAFTSKSKKDWNEKMPFDINGKELLIFEDENDLKVKLGKFISDALFKTKQASVSWSSQNEKNHVKSSSELEIFARGNIWSNVGINSNFTISYHVKIQDSATVKNPDIRFFISSSPMGYPRIVTIFPWESSELDQNKYECHIDYFKAEIVGVEQNEHLRLQQVSVAKKDFNNIKEFDVFISFCWPNLVFESSQFEDGVNRLVVPISQFRDMGFPVHLLQFIGFEAINNSHFTIDKIEIKEVFI